MLCISTMATMYFHDVYSPTKPPALYSDDLLNLMSKPELIKIYLEISQHTRNYENAFTVVSKKKYILDENEKLKKELEYAMGEGEKLFQENDRLKKELESLKQFELDRILDASMNEIFTTERQFLRESMIL